MKIKNKPTKEQQEVINHIKGNCVVIAGAGSGKTKTMVDRVRNMIEVNEINPSSILNITFTKNGATEMEERLVKNEILIDGMFIGTIHAFALRMLWKYDNKYCNYKTMSDIEKEILINKTFGNDCDLVDIFEEISLDRNILYGKAPSHTIKKYDTARRALNKIEFADMLKDFYLLLVNNENVRLELSNKYKYIIVDECQDVNTISHDIIQLIGTQGNICYVGDPNQNIFKYAYSDCDKFLNLPNHKLYELTLNFRSDKEIVKMTNKIVNINHESASENNGFYLYDERYNLTHIIDKCLSLGYDYKDIFIIYRMNSEASFIEPKLMGKNIPYIIEGGYSFFDSMEFKLIYHYLKMAHDENNESYEYTFNKPNRWLGNEFLLQMKKGNNYFKRHSTDNVTDRRFYKGIREYSSIISKMQSKKTLKKRIEIFKTHVDYEEYFRKKSHSDMEFKERIEMFDRACEFIETHKHIDDVKFEKVKNDDKNSIKLMTVHKSKGKESKVVIVMSQNMPYFRGDIVEERNIYYVACSRAMETLFVLDYQFDRWDCFE